MFNVAEKKKRKKKEERKYYHRGQQIFTQENYVYIPSKCFLSEGIRNRPLNVNDSD